MNYIIRCVWQKGQAPPFCKDVFSYGKYDTTLYGEHGRPRVFNDLNEGYCLLQQHDAAIGTSLDHYEVEEYPQ